MKKTIVISLIIIIHLSIHASEDTTGVPFVSYWEEGDSYKFNIIKIRKRWDRDLLKKADSTSYTANFTVLDASEEKYTIEWSYNNDYTKTFNINKDVSKKVLEQLLKYQEIDIIYTTSNVGEFIGVENWSEISEQMINLFRDMSELLFTDSMEKAIFVKAIDPIKKLYSTKEGIELYLVDELKFFHFPFGYEYMISDTLEYEELFPNMFGGDPIRANARIFIESADEENSKCVLVNQLSLNPDDTKRVVLELFSKMNLPEEEIKDSLDNAVYNIVDNNRFEYYYYPGIPIKIETERITILELGAQKVTNIDKTIITLIE